jgi:hypothetical protein
VIVDVEDNWFAGFEEPGQPAGIEAQSSLNPGETIPGQLPLLAPTPVPGGPALPITGPQQRPGWPGTSEVRGGHPPVEGLDTIGRQSPLSLI